MDVSGLDGSTSAGSGGSGGGGVFSGLRRELELELATIREFLGSPGGEWGRLAATAQAEARWGATPAAPVPREQGRTRRWFLVSANGALVVLVLILWRLFPSAASGAFLLGAAAVAGVLFLANVYDLALGSRVALHRPTDSRFLPVHKRRWLGRSVRLRVRMGVMWMLLSNEFTSEMTVLGPYCPNCRPRQKLTPREQRFMGLTWFGMVRSYEWACPRCRSRYERPAMSERDIADWVQGELADSDD